MIRKCSDQDLEILRKYLYKAREINLFLIGDIENYGLNNENLEIFIDIDNTINAVYLRFFNNLCLVSYSKTIDKLFLNEMIEKNNIVNINGDKSLIDTIELENFTQNDCYFAALKKLEVKVDTSNVEELNIKDISEYLLKVDSVFKTKSNYETTKSELDNNSKHIFVCKNNNEIISAASSSAECSSLAMIVGVFTLEDYRRNGYAIRCVYKLCEKLLKENKTVCLFYNNPNAAKMYKKLGFKDIGFFSMLKK